MSQGGLPWAPFVKARADLAVTPAAAKGMALLDSASPMDSGDGVPITRSGLMWPVACVRGSAMLHNAHVMHRLCQTYGVALAPHMKASMSAEVAAVQAGGSGWALTVASAPQVLAARSWGAGRLLLANETSDPALLAWVRDELARDPSFEFYYYLDSPAGTEVAGEFVGGARSAYALVECGHSGGRAGVRRFDQAAEVARAARECGLRVVGVAGYEGMLGEDRSPKAIRRVRAFGVMLRRWLSGLDGEGLLDGQSEHFVISCGGSMYSDVLAPVLARPWALSTPVRAVLRCGSFIVHDHGHYADAGRGGLGANLRPALEIWAQVLSRPEPGLVILGVGRRDVGSDLGLPVVVRSVSPAAALNGTDATVLELHDQHTLIRIAPDHALAVGDVVVFGVSHPSITMDKWPALAVLDDEDRIVGQVTTCYR